MEANTQLTTQAGGNTPALTDHQVLVAKSWGNMGLEISGVKANLVARGNAQIQAINELPEVITDIPTAEKVYEVAKKECMELTALRIIGTRKVTTALESLMVPEKELKAKVEELYTGRILPAKKLAAAKQAEAEALNQEKVSVKQWALNCITAHVANRKQYILETINTVYTKSIEGTINVEVLKAIGIEKVTPENKELLLDYVIANMGNEKKFIFEFPKYAINKISQADFDLICGEVMPNLYPLSEWAAQFKDDLISKFFDFDLAFNDKSTALARNQAAFEAEKKDIAAEAVQATAINDFKAQAVSVDATPVVDMGKALKKKYVLNMPDNTASTKAIIMATLTVWDKLEGKIAKLKQSSFQVGQMSNYLAALKNEDNNFNVTGLVWAEEVK